MVVRDCASRLRVDYVLPRVVDPGELSVLAQGEVQIDEFSKYSDTAQDHFSFQISEDSLAHGIVGGRSLVVTYGKLGAEAGSQDRVRVEAHLRSSYGPISIVNPDSIGVA